MGGLLCKVQVSIVMSPVIGRLTDDNGDGYVTGETP